MIQEDFEQHVVKLQNALLGFAKSLTHNEDEAKDLLQETSLKALSNKAMYDDSGSIKSWLYTIMRLNIGPASHTAGPTTAFAFYIVVGDTASSFLDRFFHLPETIGDS